MFTSPEFDFDDTDDPPSLRNTIGTLRCEVATSIPLREEGPTSSDKVENPDPDDPRVEEMNGSEMFVCRVVQVSPGIGEEKDRPLLYWRQRYVGVNDKG